jgi:hypothetical protein
MCITCLKYEMSAKFWGDIKGEIIEQQNSDMNNQVKKCMQTPHLRRVRFVTVPVILRCSTNSVYRVRLLRSDGQLILRSQLAPHTKQSVTDAIFIPSFVSSISVRTSQRTLHYKDQWCVRAYVCPSSPPALIFLSISTTLWKHLQFSENPSGRSQILPRARTDRRTGSN